MPPFCSHCVAQFVSTKGAFYLPTHIVWQAARFTKVAEDPHNVGIYNQDEKRKRMIFTIFIEILLVGVAVVWILNILGIISGPWGAILAAIFTVLGVEIALLQSQVPPQE